MFTVKHVDRQGNSTIVPATSVSFDAKLNAIIARGVAGDNLYDSGHIYVMNDHGKTVSVYNLETKEQKV